MFINFAKQQTELLDDEMEAAKVASPSSSASQHGGAGAAAYDVAFRNTRGMFYDCKLLQQLDNMLITNYLKRSYIFGTVESLTCGHPDAMLLGCPISSV